MIHPTRHGLLQEQAALRRVAALVARGIDPVEIFSAVAEEIGTFEAVRAGALFVSTMEPSGSPSPGQIRRVVAATLERLGVRGCAAQVAGEFGDHPDTAAASMSWALATIHTVYPALSMTPPADLRSLAFAS